MVRGFKRGVKRESSWPVLKEVVLGQGFEKRGSLLSEVLFQGIMMGKVSEKVAMEEACSWSLIRVIFDHGFCHVTDRK